MPFFDDRQTDFTVQSYNHTAWSPPGMHIHPHHELMVVLDDSKSRISINGKVYYTKQPFIAFFSPFSLHQISFLGMKGSQRFLYYFDDNFMSTYADVFKDFEVYRNSTAVIFLLPEELVSKELPLHTDALSNNEDVLLSKLLFVTAMHILLKRKDTCTVISASDQMSHIVPIIRYMSEHFHENLTSESVAQHFFMSRAKLNRDFTEYTTVSFHQFLSELRVNKAQFMLKQGYTIREIANSVGFDNVSYFCQFFKKVKGLTPLQFAKKHSFPSRKKKEKQ
ncbi:MAG: helix-turn-helix transcriptional regulator [Clostridia bacterium]|nr:helix-turn-helix transcriptional regulator [Clostridia bacterium]